ncbi:hypothetical protein [Fredinandcohnia quinoae]|uniref:Secreted protein n=1 Tax=Fredinandcohnia quinoae TaxID=2918902 RepID=A0AAW5E836_9BACI|nr:hypothetical protein [Fredinandcohnia sp. SECRCQ15]MCH1627410.1 hypothetical protein [Fredinandcohnia sp. SECRCQ15]
MKKIAIFLFVLIMMVGSLITPANAEEPNDIELNLEATDIELTDIDPGDGILSCERSFLSSDGDLYVNMQAAAVDSTTRSLQWGFRIKESARTKFGSQVKVELKTARVNNKDINPPYAPHTNSPSYNFHGSMKNYQFKGIGGGGTLKKYDLVYFHFTASSIQNYWEVTSIELKCRVS